MISEVRILNCYEKRNFSTQDKLKIIVLENQKQRAISPNRVFLIN